MKEAMKLSDDELFNQKNEKKLFTYINKIRQEWRKVIEKEKKNQKTQD